MGNSLGTPGGISQPETGLTIVRPGGIKTRIPNWPRDYFQLDDFLVAGPAAPSNNTGYGELQWWLNGAGSAFAPGLLNEIDHPGARRLRAANTASSNLEATGGPSGTLVAANFFDTISIIQVVESDLDTETRFGLAFDIGANPGVDGLFFEKLFADTEWNFVARSGGVQTRTPTGILHAPGWITARIRRISATEIAFSITTSTVLPVETLVTSNVPNGVTSLRPFYRVRSNVAATKEIYIDYFDLCVTGINR